MRNKKRKTRPTTSSCDVFCILRWRGSLPWLRCQPLRGACIGEGRRTQEVEDVLRSSAPSESTPSTSATPTGRRRGRGDFKGGSPSLRSALLPLPPLGALRPAYSKSRHPLPLVRGEGQCTREQGTSFLFYLSGQVLSHVTLLKGSSRRNNHSSLVARSTGPFRGGGGTLAFEL